MKVLVSGGGTGGHVYPALTVIETLCSAVGSQPSLAVTDLLWVGTRGGIEEEIVERAGLAFVGLDAGGLRGVGPWLRARNALRIAQSLLPARRILRQFKPDVVLVTGGYACVSMTLASRSLSLPVLIYLPDIVPGQAIRALSRFADRIAVTSEESSGYFAGREVVVTGYPVRSEVFTMDRNEARQVLGLDPDRATLLVFGGSRGAHSINRALVNGLGRLLTICQIIHVSGGHDAEWVASQTDRLPAEIAGGYHCFEYMHDMPRALVASDLVVARAGAATMGEFPAAGLPSVLVPYPYSGQHQRPNAEFMVRRGAARLLLDEDLDSRLVTTVSELIADTPALKKMEESARALARPDAAESLAAQLWSVAGQSAVLTAGVET